MLNTVKIPKDIDDAALRKSLLSDYHIEVSGGLGALAGKILRIGLMGYNAEIYNVDMLLNAIREITEKQRS